MDAVIRALLVLLVVGGALGLAALMRRHQDQLPLPRRFDRADAGVEGVNALIVEFTTPYCYECKEVLPLLKAAAVVHGAEVAVIDARERADLAAKYRLSVTPTILLVDGKGSVKQGWTRSPEAEELEEALRGVAGSVEAA